jgi:hypothetical protein
MDQFLQSVFGLDDFLLYFAMSLALLAAFLAIYVRITPYREFALIREGNVAASLSLSGAMLGLVDLGQIRAGADFVKLVREHSEDADSVARDGDFGPLIRGSDQNLPQNIRSAIFALKAGQVTEPLRVPTGFYLFRIEEITTQSYDTVRDDIFIEIQQKRFDEWREKIQKSLDVKIVNEDFFNKTAASEATIK